MTSNIHECARRATLNAMNLFLELQDTNDEHAEQLHNIFADVNAICEKTGATYYIDFVAGSCLAESYYNLIRASDLAILESQRRIEDIELACWRRGILASQVREL